MKILEEFSGQRKRYELAWSKMDDRLGKLVVTVPDPDHLGSVRISYDVLAELMTEAGWVNERWL